MRAELSGISWFVNARTDCLAEAFYGIGFVGVNVEYRVELGDLQKVFHFFGQVQKLQFAAAIFDGGEGGDHLSDAGAVDVVDVAEVDQQFGALFVQQAANGFADQGATFAESNFAAEVDYRYGSRVTKCALQTHIFT